MIHGLVQHPLKFDLAALERYPMIIRIHFIECAAEYRPANPRHMEDAIRIR